MKCDISKSSQPTLLLGVVPAKSIDYHTRRDNTEHFGLNFGTRTDRERERETELANVKKFCLTKFHKNLKVSESEHMRLKVFVCLFTSDSLLV